MIPQLELIPPPIHVLMFTSPIPSHPSTDIFLETYQSVRERLPQAPVTILADGVRSEQKERTRDYSAYLALLGMAISRMGHETTLREFGSHKHQSGMLRSVLPTITQSYVLMVEHDTPLVGPEIPWWSILRTVDSCRLDLMRFMHEADVLPEHEYLFDPAEIDISTGVMYRRTRQFSFRPHVARTDWYQSVMQTHFNWESRTMIEDAIYGTAVHSPDEFRMAVYMPGLLGAGDSRRSGHLNGRADDPKFPMYHDGKVLL